MSSNNSFSIRSLLEKEKLNGLNFLDWERSLRIVLRQERKEYVLDTAFPEALVAGATAAARNAYNAHKEASLDVTCVMLATMDSSLQKQFDKVEAYVMLEQLKDMFQEQARTERFETTKAIVGARLDKGKPVGPHVLRMIGLFETSARLGFPYSTELATDIILNSLHDGFSPFRLNFNMNGIQKTLNELHGMLKTAESSIKSEPSREVLMVRTGRVSKNSGKKGKAKGTSKAVAAKPKPKEKAGPTDSQCFYCNDKGHFKRDCAKFKEDSKNGTVALKSGISIMDIHFANNST